MFQSCKLAIFRNNADWPTRMEALMTAVKPSLVSKPRPAMPEPTPLSGERRPDLRQLRRELGWGLNSSQRARRRFALLG